MPAGWPTDDRRGKAGLGYRLRFIRMPAGEVEVESIQGRGTCVTMRFALPSPELSPPGMFGVGVATGW